MISDDKRNEQIQKFTIRILFYQQHILFSVITKSSTGHYDGKQFPIGNHRLKDEQVRLTPKTF